MRGGSHSQEILGLGGDYTFFQRGERGGDLIPVVNDAPQDCAVDVISKRV